MKIAEVWDFTAYLESFYIKDGKATSFKTNEPYTYRNSVSSECFLQGPVYSHLWEGSYFLNLEEYDGVPPSFNSGDASSDIPRRQVRPERPKNRIRFFNDCDYINVPTNSDGHYANMQYLRDLQNNVNKKITFTPGPTNVDYMFDHY